MNDFTFSFYKKMFTRALESQYDIITVHDYFRQSPPESKKTIINRIDVDVKINRLETIYEIFKSLNIVASIYVRIHSPNYNLFTFNTIKLLRKLIAIGCEVALHTELEDLHYYCGTDKQKALKQEIEFLETILETKIYGSASHGDMTACNNLDFWKDQTPKTFGLEYEAYDKKIWEHTRYISDSEWTRWKAYDDGQLRVDDRRTPIEHFEEGPMHIYLLTHPESWYNHYIHE